MYNIYIHDKIYIINSNELDEKSKIVYLCGDNISYDLDIFFYHEYLNNFRFPFRHSKLKIF